MRFSMILEMVDRLSAPAKRAKAGVGGLRASVRQMAAQVRGAAGDLRRGERSLSDIARGARRFGAAGLRQTFERAGAGARRLGRDLLALERRLKLAERAGFATGRGLRKLGGMAAGLLKSGLFAGGAAVAGGGAFALFDLFRTGGQFEQYQIQLEGIEGSAQAARKAMGWVMKFAKETPYELDDVMEAFVSLKNFGLDPMDGSLTAMGDAASAMNKPIMQAIEMLTDATTGEFERLKEFGIKARKEGDRTTFHYIKNNKKMQRSVSDNELEIKQALVEIFADRFGGGMERQSKTMFGIISNLKGMWTEFLLMVAEAGIFDFVKAKLQGLLDKVNEMAANGELEKWAKDISDRMIKAWEWGEKFIDNDWPQLKQDFHDLADAIGVVADAILELKRMKDDFSWVGKIAGPVINPLGTGLREVNRLRNGGSSGGRSPAGAPARAPARLPSDSSLLRGLPRQSAVSIGGALKIDVSGAPGLAVRATPVAAPGSNLPMEVRTGRTMRSAA